MNRIDRKSCEVFRIFIHCIKNFVGPTCFAEMCQFIESNQTFCKRFVLYIMDETHNNDFRQ